jgi:hypothetical protein
MRKIRTLVVILALNSGGIVAAGSALAAAEYGGDRQALLAELPAARHTLGDAIRQVTRGGEAATVAKFEYEDEALHLSVYTSASGLGVDAEHNRFKEYKGDPEQAEWRPETEVFEDFAHIARAAAYHTLMSMTRLSLLDIIEKAEASAGGKALWVRPIVDNGRPVFDVAVERDGELVGLRYDLVSGQPVK